VSGTNKWFIIQLTAATRKRCRPRNSGHWRQRSATRRPKSGRDAVPRNGGSGCAAYMRGMVFSHLVDPPRLFPGGVLFTMDTHGMQRTVCVIDAALAVLAPAAHGPRERLRYVMENIEGLTAIAKRKAISTLPELVVIEAADVQAEWRGMIKQP